MKTLSDPAQTFSRLSFHRSPLTFFDTKKNATSFRNLKISQSQKRILVSHLNYWIKIVDQSAEDREFIIRTSLIRYKKHLLYLLDRLEYFESRSATIHALQATSETLGTEEAILRFEVSQLRETIHITSVEQVTLKIRYYILLDILTLCGGTYVLFPLQEAYLAKETVPRFTRKRSSLPKEL